MAQQSLDLVRGTLDLMILKTLTWGAAHGYAIAAAIRRSTDDALLVEEGALYPALYRMEAKGWIGSEWGVSENNRRAKYYRLTAAGRRHFLDQQKSWNAYAEAVGKLLGQNEAPAER